MRENVFRFLALVLASGILYLALRTDFYTSKPAWSQLRDLAICCALFLFGLGGQKALSKVPPFNLIFSERPEKKKDKIL